jgi:predicted Rossmann-fold nucleotide-binding protein
MRKYWFMYLAKAFVLMPGGFGTMDELFEMLTLRQTGKVTKRLPTVLFGAQFWNEVLNFEALLNWGVISEKDLLLFHRTDSVDDAFEFITSQLEAIEHEEEARQASHGESR